MGSKTDEFDVAGLKTFVAKLTSMGKQLQNSYEGDQYLTELLLKEFDIAQLLMRCPHESHELRSN